MNGTDGRGAPTAQQSPSPSPAPTATATGAAGAATSGATTARAGAATLPSSAFVARLRLVVARLYRQLAQASGDDLNLTYAQLSALARTQEHGPLRIGELAAYEQVAAPSLTRTVAPLVGGGLLRKQPDPSDGRSMLVSITEGGGALLQRIRRERSELLARRMSRLTPEQNDTLLAALPVLELLLTEQGPELKQGPEQEQGPESGQGDEREADGNRPRRQDAARPGPGSSGGAQIPQ